MQFDPMEIEKWMQDKSPLSDFIDASGERSVLEKGDLIDSISILQGKFSNKIEVIVAEFRIVKE
jgi:hypothetical protein